MNIHPPLKNHNVYFFKDLQIPQYQIFISTFILYYLQHLYKMKNLLF